MSEHYKAYIHPQPDEMTFDQLLGHVRRTMYWDAVDGQWVRNSFYPIDRWDMLAEWLSATHSREMASVRDENAKLRQIVTALYYCTETVLSEKCLHCPLPEVDPTECHAESLMRELGIGG